MQFRYLALSAVVSLACASAHASTAPVSTFPLFLKDESPALVTNYSVQAGNIYQLTVSQPVLCANTGSATGGPSGGYINPVYQNFIFGPYSTTNGVSVQTPSPGLTYAQYKTSLSPASYVFQADASLGTPPLVCYVTDTSGARKPTRDFFEDSFDHDYTVGAAPDVYDSSVTVTVEPNPSDPTFYQYYIDINVPTPSIASTFVLRDGFNTRVLDPTNGQWCKAASTSSTSCNGPVSTGAVDFSQNMATTDLPLQARFVVYRKYNSGVSPNDGELLALAALFSPDALAEVPLGNNVSALVQPVHVTQ